MPYFLTDRATSTSLLSLTVQQSVFISPQQVNDIFDMRLRELAGNYFINAVDELCTLDEPHPHNSDSHIVVIGDASSQDPSKFALVVAAIRLQNLIKKQ
jgi:hypothetical protein